MTTTFGVSIVEWVVDCGRDLAAANEVRLAAKVTHHGTFPGEEHLTEYSDELFFV